MVERGRRKRVDRSQAVRYRTVGQSLLTSAQALSTVAEPGDPYGNALGIIAIHAAIAYCDALSVGYGGLRSAEGDHDRALEAFQEALGAAANPDMSRLLRSILNEKDTISYQGEYYSLEDATRVLERAARFCVWAEGIYERRPA